MSLSRKSIYGPNRTRVELVSPICIVLRFLLRPFRFFQLGCIILWFLGRHYVNIVFLIVVIFVEIATRATIKYQVIYQTFLSKGHQPS